MRDGFIEYEIKNGIHVNYKRFSLIMSNDDEIIGVLNAYTAFAEIYVDDIWVDKKYQRKGLGKKLLSNLYNHFRGKGFNNGFRGASAFFVGQLVNICLFIP